ncbi:hypothetical protein ERX27_05320 [Macrococcus brunensis]|uniref:GRAM domain-containing protein n=1 Tax=Macrococcus brunensis TaxID=198483 RepID=A0A4R6BE76_9STAP|nr:hypothetical protein [Macrococcus brunensis]TDL98097.1 hypothetical protein ERX27_05320 [Macrococcus brunensis]ULG74521.1 hypothetical protein MGG13_01750 [Macrococcus brunensis]
MNYVGQSVKANYIKGFESIGGNLHFYDDGFEFKPHALNIQKHNPFIYYNDISSVSKRNTLGLVPNGILVSTKDGTEHKLVVFNRQHIMRFLDEVRS